MGADVGVGVDGVGAGVGMDGVSGVGGIGISGLKRCATSSPDSAMLYTRASSTDPFIIQFVMKLYAVPIV